MLKIGSVVGANCCWSCCCCCSGKLLFEDACWLESCDELGDRKAAAAIAAAINCSGRWVEFAATCGLAEAAKADMEIKSMPQVVAALAISWCAAIAAAIAAVARFARASWVSWKFGTCKFWWLPFVLSGGVTEAPRLLSSHELVDILAKSGLVFLLCVDDNGET